jgi:hypothetical protein
MASDNGDKKPPTEGRNRGSEDRGKRANVDEGQGAKHEEKKPNSDEGGDPRRDIEQYEQASGRRNPTRANRFTLIPRREWPGGRAGYFRRIWMTAE